MTRRAALAALAALLAACSTGPQYRRPALEMPAAWKTEPPWREAAPDDGAAKGPWWRRFDDARLDALITRALAASPTLVAAQARLAQARAGLASAESASSPQVSLSSRLARQRISAVRPLTNYAVPNQSTVQSDLFGAFSVAYEVDLAGRVRSTIDGASASAEQSAIDLENARLVLAADVATAYFALRATDVELDVITRATALQRRSLEYATARHDLGAASGLDVAQQRALLDATLTQLDVTRRQRDLLEHALATLTGTPAPLFALAADIRPVRPPAVPLGVPSDILQRRPDVASAERAMAAANAQIGVATAAFYPSITLSPTTYGTQAASLSTIASTPAVVWSLGTSLLAPIFDAGRAAAGVDAARAAYDATVANYRRVVLVAMQEVQDGITGLAALERAAAQAGVAIGSARRVLELATSRYEGGVATALEVISAQQGLLANERLAAQLQGQQLLTTVFLVKALGGDWQRAGYDAGVSSR